MMLIFGLMLLLLLQTAACLEFNCRFNQSDPCYAALGHKLNLKMVDASIYHLKIQKRINNNPDDPVCRVKNDKIKECDLFNNRAEVTVINGTLIINRVIRADSGNYTLKLDGSNGTVTSTDLQVNVEAPIGSVEVSISCSSNGMKSVSCSSDGDQLIYSWTLNGESMMDGNTTIELNEETDGNIICSVKNHVSHGQKNIRVKHCPGSTTAAVTSSLTSTVTSSTQTSDHGTSFSPSVIQMSLIALGCVSLILILLFITACHFYKRKQLQSTPAPAGDTELVYAQISHDKHKKSEKNKSESLPTADVEYAAVRPQTKRKEKKEEEVQYGEVTFTPNRSNALQESKEECVYSQVQRR
ncbi:uncharacterized protein [Chanodichthys erythropterus]|uniref:uncharacterized protein isoform X2 n=1 Tax=Chanodichthys erythropterus TaxID=933992 RepID=UPI00351DFC6F